MKSSSIRTTLKTARGLGSGHDGTHHFWLERVSALALIPLSLWFMVELVSLLSGTNKVAIGSWLRDPMNALFMSIFFITMFFHSKLGVQVIIEDYVHDEGKKLALLLLSNALHYVMAGACLVAIAHLHIMGI